MSIKCVIRSLNVPQTRKKILYPDVVNATTIDENAFIDFVATNRKLERGQVKAVLAGVSDSLAELLGMGHLVKVDGVGSFSVDVKGSIEPDKRGVLQLKNAKIKSVKVKPSSKLIKQLDDSSFTLLTHDARSRNILDQEKAEQLAKSMLEGAPFFSTSDFRAKTGASNAYALKLLNAMVEKGIIARERLGRGYVWVKA